MSPYEKYAAKGIAKDYKERTSPSRSYFAVADVFEALTY
jgi:hypothetical protein